MARTHSEAQYSTAQRLQAFYDRADEVRSHPLFNKAQEVAGFGISFTAKGGALVPGGVLDLKLRDDGEWIPLACLVRPLMFSTTDKSTVPNILALIGHEAPGVRHHVAEITEARKQWVKLLIMGYQENIAPNPEEQRNRIEISAEFDINPNELANDYVMASEYLSGYLFHFNLDQWNLFKLSAPETLLVYKKAAQIRVVSSCEFIERTRQLIEFGWRKGILPK